MWEQNFNTFQSWKSSKYSHSDSSKAIFIKELKNIHEKDFP